MHLAGPEWRKVTAMIWMVRTLGMLIALGIAGLSCAMTFSFGLAFAEGADRLIYAGLFSALDGAKFLLPTLAAVLAINGMISQARMARFCWVFFAMLSASSHVGLTLKASGDAKTAQTGTSEAQTTYDTKRKELDNLGVIRSKGKIEADIAQIERDPIFTDEKKSNGCVNDTATASRTLCDRWRAVKGELSDRADHDRLTGEVAQAKTVLDAARGTGGKANALAQAMSSTFGISESAAVMVLAILMAIGIEMGSSLLMELAAAAGHKPRQEAAPDTISAPFIAPNDADQRDMEPEPAPVPVDLPVMDAKEWVEARMTGKKSASSSWDDVLAAYISEAADAGMKPQSSIMLSKAVKGPYETKRISGKTRVLGAVMKTKQAGAKLSIVK